MLDESSFVGRGFIPCQKEAAYKMPPYDISKVRKMERKIKVKQFQRNKGVI